MTNWMTAAGLALIAGGLATPICFRSVLFGARRRGSRRRSMVAARAGRAAEPVAVPVGDPHGGLSSLGFEEDLSFEEKPGFEEQVDEPDLDSHPGIESGLDPALDFADDEPEFSDEPDAEPEEEFDEAAFEGPPTAFDEPARHEPPAAFDEPARHELPATFDEPARHEPGSSVHRYGHRIDGWVRPEYRHVPEEPPAGEYWTPIPVELDPDPEPSAKGYGWPTPVERLPAVPDYEPATGFDLAPVEHEPTETVPAWPPLNERSGRIRLPRDWASRNEKRREWRDEQAPAPTQLFAAVGDEPRPATRRRPRPRPRPTVTPPDRNTTIYVSRHAADPPR